MRDMIRVVDVRVPPHEMTGVKVCREFSIEAGILGEVHGKETLRRVA